jgi:hypothetical protein
MPTPLILRVERARQNGYSDHEILNHLRAASPTWAERIQAMAWPGDSPAQTLARLLATVEPAPLELEQALAALGEDNGRPEIEAFVRTLGARVDSVVPRGALDLKLPPDAVSWEQWHHQRNSRIFAEARRHQAPESREAREAREKAREAEEKAERKAWTEHWRQIGHGWCLFQRALARAPVEAKKYQAANEDPEAKWLIDLGTGQKIITVNGRDITRGKL